MNKRLQGLRDKAERLRYDAKDRSLFQSESDVLRAAGDLAELVRDLVDLLLEDEDRYESTRGSEEPRR